MRFRRRRGLGGGRGSRSGGGDGGDDGARDAPPGDASPGGSGAGGPGGPVDRLKRWGAALAVLAALVGAGYLVSAFLVFPASAPEAAAGEVVEVPDLVGLTAEEARSALDGKRLDYLLTSEMPHPEAPEGAVVAQSPLPGQFARPGAPVEVTLSLGPERRTVPDLRGLSDRQARIVLERLGFRTSVDTAQGELERGRVMATRPSAGSEVEVPHQVTVLVSRGPRVADVPELVGLHVDDVPARLRERGFRLGEVTYDAEAFAAPGRVIGQSPAPGYSLRAGGRVSVRVAGSAPEMPADTAAPDTSGARGPPPGSGRRDTSIVVAAPSVTGPSDAPARAPGDAGGE